MGISSHPRVEGMRRSPDAADGSGIYHRGIAASLDSMEM